MPYLAKLEAIDENNSHAILLELAFQGASDYYALPVPVRSEALASITLATNKLGGFSDDDIMKFDVLAVVLGPAVYGIELQQI